MGDDTTNESVKKPQTEETKEETNSVDDNDGQQQQPDKRSQFVEMSDVFQKLENPNKRHLFAEQTLKSSRSLSMLTDGSQKRSPSPIPRQVTGVQRTHKQYSMPSYLNKQKGAVCHLHHSRLDEHIINCNLSIAAKKDFNEEVRALVDVRKFVKDSFILTDITEVRIVRIVEQVVDRLVECRGLGEEVAQEAKDLLFVERSTLHMLLANTMQGLYKSRADGRIAYDHSWVVATGSLSTLNKRQVAITRFPQPVNFGRQSHEVRFLIVVLAPSREKLTKSAWETGRTFATMFTDINFRRQLLRAKTQDEFKQELLQRAETLARESEEAAVAAAAASGLEEFYGGGGGGNSKTSYQISDDTESGSSSSLKQQLGCCGNLLGSLGSGLADDFKRRCKFYLSDFTDGFLGDQSIYKTISTTVFLYFSVLLPCIAFGVVDTNNTDGQIDPKKTMIGQAVGGLFFALFSGQPLVVIMTTAPLCIYVKVIYQIAQDLEVEFSSFYACVGLWMCLFLVVMSLTNSSNLMRFCTRSTEDIFALFTAFAFGSDGIKEAIRSFEKYYWEPDCTAHGTILVSRIIPDQSATLPLAQSSPTKLGADGLMSAAQNNIASLLMKNMTPSAAHVQATYTTSPLAADLADHLQHNPVEHHDILQHSDLGAGSRCSRETCVLFLFLMCGTLWLANSFSAFNKTPYLSSRKREIIKDYALAISVLIFSFIGSYLFSDIRLDVFEFSEFTGLQFAQVNLLSAKVILVGCPLGFMLAVLFYIDQNICGAMVNNAPYKLKKGNYFHLDLLVLAALNALLSLTGLPWMHGKLPHSHLHSKALADYEERVDEGHVHQSIVNIRETRLTGILVSILVGVSLLAVPYPISYIPLPVLSGVFLYTALAELKSNSMVERICLLFTEQAAYPPNHYIRRCPQRKIHLFTLTQIVQLALVTFIGFYPNPYVKMAFPLAVATFVPIRNNFLPHLINTKYLNSLDTASLE